ncbi:MAG: permease, partial [Dehalococcoidia bacterium]
LFSVVIGLLMARIFRRQELERSQEAFDALDTSAALKGWQTAVFIAVQIGFLVAIAWGLKIHVVRPVDGSEDFGTWRLIEGVWLEVNWIAIGFTVLFALALIEVLRRWFTREMISEWMKSTWSFFKMIALWLLGGIVAAGMIGVVLPSEWVERFVGGDSVSANFLAAFTGALFYFATLTEVPIVRTFMDAGMGSGPALALLLAGPALSLPAMLVLRNIMGTKKMLTYVGLVVIMATISGIVFGLITS